FELIPALDERRTDLVRDVVSLRAEGLECLGVVFLVGLGHLLIELADLAILLRLCLVSTDGRNDLLDLGLGRLRRVRRRTGRLRLSKYWDCSESGDDENSGQLHGGLSGQWWNLCAHSSPAASQSASVWRYLDAQCR